MTYIFLDEIQHVTDFPIIFQDKAIRRGIVKFYTRQHHGTALTYYIAGEFSIDTGVAANHGRTESLRIGV